MVLRRFQFAFLSLLLVAACGVAATAQEADNSKAPFPSKAEQDQPKTIRELMQKMRIEQEKKDYEEMLDRGQQAIRISEELELSFSRRSSLTRNDIEKLEVLEKLVKKIRGELGGSDDDQPDADDDDPSPNSIAEGFKSLQSLTVSLLNELKKTSRFGISAVAIKSSNAVLKVVRFLRLSK